MAAASSPAPPEARPGAGRRRAAGAAGAAAGLAYVPLEFDAEGHPLAPWSAPPAVRHARPVRSPDRRRPAAAAGGESMSGEGRVTRQRSRLFERSALQSPERQLPPPYNDPAAAELRSQRSPARLRVPFEACPTDSGALDHEQPEQSARWRAAAGALPSLASYSVAGLRGCWAYGYTNAYNTGGGGGLAGVGGLRSLGGATAGSRDESSPTGARGCGAGGFSATNVAAGGAASSGCSGVCGRGSSGDRFSMFYSFRRLPAGLARLSTREAARERRLHRRGMAVALGVVAFLFLCVLRVYAGPDRGPQSQPRVTRPPPLGGMELPPHPSIMPSPHPLDTRLPQPIDGVWPSHPAYALPHEPPQPSETRVPVLLGMGSERGHASAAELQQSDPASKTPPSPPPFTERPFTPSAFTAAPLTEAPLLPPTVSMAGFSPQLDLAHRGQQPPTARRLPPLLRGQRIAHGAMAGSFSFFPSQTRPTPRSEPPTRGSPTAASPSGLYTARRSGVRGDGSNWSHLSSPSADHTPGGTAGARTPPFHADSGGREGARMLFPITDRTPGGTDAARTPPFHADSIGGGREGADAGLPPGIGSSAAAGAAAGLPPGIGSSTAAGAAAGLTPGIGSSTAAGAAAGTAGRAAHRPSGFSSSRAFEPGARPAHANFSWGEMRAPGATAGEDQSSFGAGGCGGIGFCDCVSTGGCERKGGYGSTGGGDGTGAGQEAAAALLFSPGNAYPLAPVGGSIPGGAASIFSNATGRGVTEIGGRWHRNPLGSRRGRGETGRLSPWSEIGTDGAEIGIEGAEIGTGGAEIWTDGLAGVFSQMSGGGGAGDRLSTPVQDSAGGADGGGTPSRNSAGKDLEGGPSTRVQGSAGGASKEGERTPPLMGSGKDAGARPSTPLQGSATGESSGADGSPTHFGSGSGVQGGPSLPLQNSTSGGDGANSRRRARSLLRRPTSLSLAALAVLRLPSLLPGTPPSRLADAPAWLAGFPAQIAELIPGQMAGLPAQLANVPAHMAKIPAHFAGIPARLAQMAYVHARIAHSPAPLAGIPARTGLLFTQTRGLLPRLARWRRYFRAWTPGAGVMGGGTAAAALPPTLPTALPQAWGINPPTGIIDVPLPRASSPALPPTHLAPPPLQLTPPPPPHAPPLPPRARLLPPASAPPIAALHPASPPPPHLFTRRHLVALSRLAARAAARRARRAAFRAFRAAFRAFGAAFPAFGAAFRAFVGAAVGGPIQIAQVVLVLVVAREAWGVRRALRRWVGHAAMPGSESVGLAMAKGEGVGGTVVGEGGGLRSPAAVAPSALRHPPAAAWPAATGRLRRHLVRLRAGLWRAAARLLPNTGGGDPLLLNTGGGAPRVHPRPLCVAALAGAGAASAVGAGLGGPPLASAAVMLASAAWEACAALRALGA
jgi:hypothetical protein